MLDDKVLDKNVLPFKLTGTFDDFQRHYIIAKKTKNLDSLNYVFNELAPTFSCWDFQLTNKDYYSNITIYTLLRLLQADTGVPGTLENKLNLLYSHFAFYSLSFFDICLEALLLHINKKSYIPMYKYSKPKDLYYYIAKEVKMFIFSIIRKCVAAEARRLKAQPLEQVHEVSYTTQYLELDIVDTLSDTNYAHYLHILAAGSPPAKKSLDYDETFIKENLICQLTKTLPSNN